MPEFGTNAQETVNVNMIQHAGGGANQVAIPLGTTLAEVVDQCGAGNFDKFTFTVINNKTGAQTQVTNPQQAANTRINEDTRVVQTPNNLAGA